MRMTLQEFLMRGIPEAFLFIFAVITFSSSVIKLKRFLLSGFVLGLSAYLIRLIPIQSGMHTIFSMIILIIIAILVYKINLIIAIQAAVISVIIEFVCENINVFIIRFILKADVSYVFTDPMLKTLYGIPSLLIYGCILFIIYFKRKKTKLVTDDVENGLSK